MGYILQELDVLILLHLKEDLMYGRWNPEQSFGKYTISQRKILEQFDRK